MGVRGAGKDFFRQTLGLRWGIKGAFDPSLEKTQGMDTVGEIGANGDLLSVQAHGRKGLIEQGHLSGFLA